MQVFVFDPFTIERQGIVRVLEDHPKITLVEESGNAKDAFVKVKNSQPDVTILELSLPSLPGLTIASKIKGQNLPTGIVFLSNLAQKDFVSKVMKTGAQGYVLKSDTPKDLLLAVTKATRGSVYLSSSLSKFSDEAAKSTKSKDVREKRLTKREQEVLKLIAQDLTNKEIANRLSLSIKTIENHRANIIEKLGAKSCAELTLYAIRLGLISL